MRRSATEMMAAYHVGADVLLVLDGPPRTAVPEGSDASDDHINANGGYQGVGLEAVTAVRGPERPDTPFDRPVINNNVNGDYQGLEAVTAQPERPGPPDDMPIINVNVNGDYQGLEAVTTPQDSIV